MRPRLLLVLTLLLGFAVRAAAEGPEDQYIRIYNLIQQADGLEGGAPAQALVKFLEAQNDLRRFQKNYPGWNPKIVNFRLDYISARVNALSNQRSAPIQPNPESIQPVPGVAAPSAPPVPTPNAGNTAEVQFEQLKTQVRQLQADKSVLEAKLKEALSSQPAAWDPGEVVKANEKIKSLEKENALLKVTVATEKSRVSPVPDTRSQTGVALAEANRKLAEETEHARTLGAEKDALQLKLDSLIPESWNAKNIEQTKKSLDNANAKLAVEQEKTRKLAAEKDTLEARVKTLTAENETAPAMRAENQMLKKQLADLKSAPSPGRTTNPSQRLAEAEAQIAALQSDKEMLRLEKIALEGRIKQLSSGAVSPVAPMLKPATNIASGPKTDEAMRIKLLERERDDLQKKLEAALREVYGRKGKGKGTHVEEMELQLAALRARLDVFEARQIPYSAEELVLFKKPEPQIIANPAPAKSGRKSVNELPPGTSSLVAEAQRYFSAKQYDKAEQNYLQVLNKDEKNVPTLANLALIQLQLNHLDEAEKNAKKAVALAPDDAYSFSVLGQVKFRQEKYDEALDALSQAARMEPQNAQVQNLLGLTLSQKGMRGPAETALRKAIQLEPGYGDAHNNLAVVYVTQQPPLVELAKWHYQKALAAGNPHNAFLEKAFATKAAGDSPK